MKSFAVRRQIEDMLADRMASPLTVRERAEPERVASGLEAVDRLLGGGVPTGVISEVVGSECSGRTTAALAYLSAVTGQGNVCAWIDVSDALDPESAAANGVDLARLLWVRCGQKKTDPVVVAKTEAKSAGVFSAFAAGAPRHSGGGSPHPRSEGRDMPHAIGQMLQAHGGLYDKQMRRERKHIGTPGAPNRPLSWRSEDREEQVNSDRLPARRGGNVAMVAMAPRCAEPQPRRDTVLPARNMTMPHMDKAVASGSTGGTWQALDQALRAADLLLQNGGFSAIVLDLGSTPAEVAWKIPMATWFRFRAACERTRVSLILLTQHPCARSSAELVVRMSPGGMEAEGRVMTGVRYSAEVERQRFAEAQSKVVPIRKPPQSERPGHWKSEAAWAQSR